MSRHKKQRRLAAEDLDLSLIGFVDGELDALLSGLEDETDTEGEDDIPEPPEDPVSRPGDLWVLGNHRLLCGNAMASRSSRRCSCFRCLVCMQRWRRT